MALVNPYVLYELGVVVRRLLLAAVSETVRKAFQSVIRHRSNKQMAAYSKSQLVQEEEEKEVCLHCQE